MCGEGNKRGGVGGGTDELTDITCDALGSNFISRQLSGWKVHRTKPTSPSTFVREERCTQQELHVSSERHVSGLRCSCKAVENPGMVCGVKSMS